MVARDLELRGQDLGHPVQDRLQLGDVPGQFHGHHALVGEDGAELLLSGADVAVGETDVDPTVVLAVDPGLDEAFHGPGLGDHLLDRHLVADVDRAVAVHLLGGGHPSQVATARYLGTLAGGGGGLRLPAGAGGQHQASQGDDGSPHRP